ncbi:TatD family hydrolase [Candidatus Undinarchaeota archaeon]
MLVDTHAHLHFKNFNKDRGDVVRRAKEKLEFIVEVGVNHSTNTQVLNLCNEYYDFIYPAIGLHPTDALPDELDKIKTQIASNKDSIIAIGEVGLDYYHEKDQGKQAYQRDTFSEMLLLAEKLDLPVITHTRNAEADAIEILSSFNIKSVIMHCFSDNSLANKCLDRGYWVSIPTIVCFLKEKQELVEIVGIEKMLLETDCPFLSPFRASRNEPSYVENSARTISQILNTTFENVSLETTKNAKKAFEVETWKESRSADRNDTPDSG